jgi:hypothetical protein
MSVAAGSLRPLRFESLDEIAAECERLSAGKCATTGNWSLAQIIEHLARAYDMALDGVDGQAPWIIRAVVKVMLWTAPGLFFDRTMRAGFKLPKNASKLLPPDEVGLTEALDHLRRSIARFQTDTRRSPHPVFGTLTNEQWTKLHQRHAELHLGFVQPK